MGELQRLTPGKSLEALDSSTWNSFVDATNFYKQNRQNQTLGQKKAPGTDNIAIVRNDSGSDLEAFTPVILDSLINIPSSDGQPLLADGPVFSAKKAASDNLTKPSAILLDAIKNGKVGKVMVSGCSIIRLKLNSATDEFADLKETGSLESGASGPYRLLGKGATGDDSWAVAQFPYATGGGSSIKVYQVKSVNSTTNIAKVAPITLLVDSSAVPNFTSASESSSFTDARILRS